MSNLLVQNIKHTNGTTAQTIDSSGRILTPARPMFYATGPLSNVPAGVADDTDIVFPTTDFNVGGHYSTSTGKFIAPIAGIYQFHTSVMGDNAANRMMIRIHLNGSNHAQGSSSSASNGYQDSKVSVLMQLSQNDEINVHNAGPKTTYNIRKYEAYFWGMLVG